MRSGEVLRRGAVASVMAAFEGGNGRAPAALVQIRRPDGVIGTSAARDGNAGRGGARAVHGDLKRGPRSVAGGAILASGREDGLADQPNSPIRTSLETSARST